MRRYIIGIVLLLASLTIQAQRFFNLTADEVRVDTLLPVFNYAYPVGTHYTDSTYDVAIEYPEFVPMSAEEISRYQHISGAPLSAMPEIYQSVSVDRKQGTLHIGFIPLVFRDGQYQKLVSFKLNIRGKEENVRRASAIGHHTSAISRYAENSVLRSGSWAKIRVPVTGIYQLTSDLIKKAGFNDINKVKIYGYGGARQPEQLTAEYLTETDVLSAARRLLYAVRS